jgi:Flp pilus assembly pilin Flp
VVHSVVTAVRRWVDRASAAVLAAAVGAQLALRLALGRAGLALARGHAGQSMVEYGIVVALIAIVAFAAVQMLGDSVTAVFTSIMNKLVPFTQPKT